MKVIRSPYAMPRHLLSLALMLGAASAAWAQPAPPPEGPGPRTTSATEGTSPASATTAVQAPSDDMVLDPAQPDFSLINLPTTLRLAKFKSSFRVTHRFNRPLGQGDFGNLLEDAFGFDAGALIGLEYRFGIWDGWQAGLYRTSDRTIQFFTKYNLTRQGEGMPVAIDAYATAEGTNNFRDSYSPAVGAVISRSFGEHAALYAMPMWVNNTNDLPSEVIDDNDTFVVGLGGRIRVRPTVYLVGEFVPRVSGYEPGKHMASFAIEKRAGGHAFQINVSNTVASTLAQIARSNANNDDWFIGFNISRKFY